LVQVHAYSQGINHVNAFNGTEVASAAAKLFVTNFVNAPLHISGIQVGTGARTALYQGTTVKLHSAAQREGICFPVVAHLPAFHQVGQHFPLLVEGVAEEAIVGPPDPLLRPHRGLHMRVKVHQILASVRAQNAAIFATGPAFFRTRRERQATDQEYYASHEPVEAWEEMLQRQRPHNKPPPAKYCVRRMTPPVWRSIPRPW